jgi:iodotyrosine deiodinase
MKSEKLNHHDFPKQIVMEKSRKFLELIKRRRSVRTFSEKAVPRQVIENCLAAAGRAPSGANQQPWHFVAIANRAVKHKIRQAAEKIEQSFYQNLAGEAWLKSLEPLATNAHKPFLESAPWLIAVFAQKYTILNDGTIQKNYYVTESVGIATGILVTALHYCGLTTLTYTPSPMHFLSKILNRPKNEKPFLLLVTGYPAQGTRVPRITKKNLEDICLFID